jgi:hypothetical protein
MKFSNFIIIVICQLIIISTVSYFFKISFPIYLERNNVRNVNEISWEDLPGKFGKYNLDKQDENALRNMIVIIESDGEIISTIFSFVHYAFYVFIIVLTVSISQIIYFAIRYYKKRKTIA